MFWSEIGPGRPKSGAVITTPSPSTLKDSAEKSKTSCPRKTLPKTLAKTLPELRISDGGAPATKVALAEQILEYSERNLQLTMKMLMGTEVDVEPLVTEQSDNNAAISRLLQRIREQVVSQRERELLESASAQWFRSSYGASDGKQAGFDPGTATVNLMLPLLLDNNSWKVFVYFLQYRTTFLRPDKTRSRRSLP